MARNSSVSSVFNVTYTMSSVFESVTDVMDLLAYRTQFQFRNINFLFLYSHPRDNLSAIYFCLTDYHCYFPPLITCTDTVPIFCTFKSQ